MCVLSITIPKPYWIMNTNVWSMMVTWLNKNSILYASNVTGQYPSINKQQLDGWWLNVTQSVNACECLLKGMAYQKCFTIISHSLSWMVERLASTRSYLQTGTWCKNVIWIWREQTISLRMLYHLRSKGYHEREDCELIRGYAWNACHAACKSFRRSGATSQWTGCCQSSCGLAGQLWQTALCSTLEVSTWSTPSEHHW